MTVTLSDEDAKALTDAGRRAMRAQEALTLAVARARIPFMEAAAAKNDVIDRLATAHGFDPDQPFTFDPKTRVLTQGEPGGAP
jgi:hypothetical protein